MSERFFTFLSPQDVKITNPYLDEEWIEQLSTDMLAGKCCNHELGSVLVRKIPDKGYFVVDGNHFVVACRRIGQKKFFAQVFTLDMD